MNILVTCLANIQVSISFVFRIQPNRKSSTSFNSSTTVCVKVDWLFK